MLYSTLIGNLLIDRLIFVQQERRHNQINLCLPTIERNQLWQLRIANEKQCLQINSNITVYVEFLTGRLETMNDVKIRVHAICNLTSCPGHSKLQHIYLNE